MIYSWLKALHIISVICWMAGILYLIRLFVYHAAETEKIVKDRFEIMERRLYKAITLPSMLAAYVFGLSMLSLNPYLWHQPWMWAKLFLVVVLTQVTLFAKRWHRELV